MNWSKIFSKKTVLLVAFGIVMFSAFTSCHRDGCPGQITKVNTHKANNG